MPFDLTTNPFFILDVSPRDNRACVSSAVEARLVEAKSPEEVLRKAERELFASKTRLMAEVSWLIEASPGRVKDIRSKFLLPTVDISVSTIAALLQETESITCANLAAHFCARGFASEKIVELLIEAWEDISVEKVRKLVNGVRKIADYPEVFNELVRESLSALKDSHARAILNWITVSEHPGRLLSSVVERTPTEESARVLIEQVVEHYDSWAIPQLKAFENEISSLIELMKKDGESRVLSECIHKIVDLLRQWDEYSQPSQLLHQSKGLDEPRAQRVFNEMRDISVWLANERHLPALSLEFSRALSEIFPELPVSMAKLEDIKTLTGIVAQAQDHEDIAQLLAVLDTILKDEENFNRSVLRGELSEHGPGIAGDFLRAIIAARDKSAGSGRACEVWTLARGIAVHFCNEKKWVETSLAITKALLELRPPEEHRKQLEEDARGLEQILIRASRGGASQGQNKVEANSHSRALVTSSPNEKARSGPTAAPPTAEAWRDRSNWSPMIALAVFGVIIVVGITSVSSSSKAPYSRGYSHPSVKIDYGAPSTYQEPPAVAAPRSSAAGETLAEPWKTSFALVAEMLSAKSIERVLEIKKTLELSVSVPRGNTEEAQKLNAIGLSHFDLRSFIEAAQSFEMAINADVGNVEAWNNLGYSLLKAEKLDKAAGPFFVSLSLAPGRSSAWANLGELLAFRNDEERSQRAFLLTLLFSRDTLQTLLFLERLRLSAPTRVEKIVASSLWAGLMLESKAATRQGNKLLSGDYWGHTVWPPSNDGRGTLNVQPFFARLQVTAGRCSGEIAGELSDREGVKRIAPTSPDASSCELFLLPDNKGRVLVIENHCQYFRGVECGFSGLYTGQR